MLCFPLSTTFLCFTLIFSQRRVLVCDCVEDSVVEVQTHVYAIVKTTFILLSCSTSTRAVLLWWRGGECGGARSVMRLYCCVEADRWVVVVPRLRG
jgi:hypothetical protein